jgi:hypothetical protein
LTGLVTAPPGVDQAGADAFATALAAALVAAGQPVDPDILQVSLLYMDTYCQILDSIAETDPTGVDEFLDRLVAGMDGSGVPADVSARVKASHAAMFNAAADHLCPQHAEVLHDAAAELARAQP